MRIASSVIMCVGLVLLGASIFWERIAPGPPELTEELETKYEQAISDAHGVKPEAISDETKAVLEKVQAQTESYDETRSVGKTVLWVSGLVLALVGAGIFFWKGRADE